MRVIVQIPVPSANYLSLTIYKDMSKLSILSWYSNCFPNAEMQIFWGEMIETLLTESWFKHEANIFF